MERWVVTVVLAMHVLACGSADDGEIGGHCYANGTCNVGLTCSSGICVPVDAAVDALVVDSPICSPDALEANDTISTATASGVASMQTSRTFTGLSICQGDKDYFLVTITMANQNLEMIVDENLTNAGLQGSILNSGGQALANATPVSGNLMRLRAFTPNLPTGTYYAFVSAGPTIANTYQLQLNVTGP